jgi:hypothetical protein
MWAPSAVVFVFRIPLVAVDNRMETAGRDHHASSSGTSRHTSERSAGRPDHQLDGAPREAVHTCALRTGTTMIRSKHVTVPEIDGTNGIIIFKEPAGFQAHRMKRSVPGMTHENDNERYNQE